MNDLPQNRTAGLCWGICKNSPSEKRPVFAFYGLNRESNWVQDVPRGPGADLERHFHVERCAGGVVRLGDGGNAPTEKRNHWGIEVQGCCIKWGSIGTSTENGSKHFPVHGTDRNHPTMEVTIQMKIAITSARSQPIVYSFCNNVSSQTIPAMNTCSRP